MSLHEPSPIYAFKFVIYERLERASKDSTIGKLNHSGPIQICKWLATDAIPSSQSIQRFKDFLQHPAAPTVIIPWASFFGSAGLKGRLSFGSVRSVALHLPSTT